MISSEYIESFKTLTNERAPSIIAFIAFFSSCDITMVSPSSLSIMPVTLLLPSSTNEILPISGDLKFKSIAGKFFTSSANECCGDIIASTKLNLYINILTYRLI